MFEVKNVHPKPTDALRPLGPIGPFRLMRICEELK